MGFNSAFEGLRHWLIFRRVFGTYALFSQNMKENLSPGIISAKYMEVEKVNLLIRIQGTVVP